MSLGSEIRGRPRWDDGLQDAELQKQPNYNATNPEKTVCYEDNPVLDDVVMGVKFKIVQGTKSFRERQTSWKSLVRRATSWGSINATAKNWTPLTLKASLLGSFITVSFSLVAILEVISHVSSQRNGLAFAESTADIPASSIFLFLYLPTVIAVCYSTFWTWVDLDVKRLEPWFQLSNEGGATAEDSLLLHYTFDFLAFVPLRAAKRRQWSVVYTGVAMMIIFWAITPFQSAIFGIGSTTQSRNETMTPILDLIPVSRQAETLDATFMNNAYGVLWLGEALPAFTTSRYALQPFAPNDKTIVTSSKSGIAHNGSMPIYTTWQANTYMFDTELSCWTANITPAVDHTYTFDNGRGCIVPEIGLPGGQFASSNITMLYIGYQDSALTDYALKNPKCGPAASHQFLAVWGFGTSSTNAQVFANITGVFCETSYYSQEVTATVRATDFSVVEGSVVNISQRQNLSESRFNITNFETVLGTGATTVTGPHDYPDIAILEQFPRLANDGLIWPVTNMVGFAIGGQNISTTQYYSITNLHEAFESAHKLLFALAYNALSGPPDGIVSPVQGTVVNAGTAILVSRVFSIVVEACLIVVSLLAAALLYSSSRRQSNLSCDPASMGSIIDAIRGSDDLLREFQGRDLLTDTALEESLSGKTFSLSMYEGTDGMKMALQRNQKANEPSITSTQQISTFYKPIQPVEMQFAIASIFIGVLCGGFAILIYLQVIDQRLHGLPRPTNNRLVLQFLENYLPTIFATLLEPFWVVLNRLLCVLQPFAELWKGNARPSRSIDAKYTSLPPQLAFWRALRSHHLLLASVCWIALSANILAIALSGIFNEDVILTIHPWQYSYALAPEFDGSALTNFSAGAVDAPPVTYSDHYYVAATNLTKGTKLPSWTSSNFYFIPFTMELAGTDALEYRAVTQGFGASLECKAITPNSTGQNITFEVNRDNVQFSTREFDSSASESPVCVGVNESNGPDQTTISESPLPNDAAAMEIMTSMVSFRTGSTNRTTNDAFCQTMIIAGWIRLGALNATTNISPLRTIDNRTLDYSFLSCQPTLLSAPFNVTVDQSGHVLSADRLSPFDTNASAFATGNGSVALSLLSQASQLIGSPGLSGSWHNDSVTHDWPNTLIKIITNTSMHVDPDSPPPTLSPNSPVKLAMENLYPRLFAILLGLNTHVFAPATTMLLSNRNTTGTILVKETRIFISQPLFYTAATLLALNILVALAYYILRPKKFLPRMPTTIASMIAYIAASHALTSYGPNEDYVKASSYGTRDVDSDRKRNGNGYGNGPTNASIRKKPTRYGFGRFIGVDGKTHVGIERQDLVVPLETRNPMTKRRRWTSAWGTIGTRRDDEREPRVWI